MPATTRRGERAFMNRARRVARVIWSAVRELHARISEVHRWQRRIAVLSMAPDRFIPNANRAPDTFGEFLTRTSGPMLREPSSRARLAGRPVG